MRVSTILPASTSTSSELPAGIPRRRRNGLGGTARPLLETSIFKVTRYRSHFFLNLVEICFPRLFADQKHSSHKETHENCAMANIVRANSLGGYGTGIARLNWFGEVDRSTQAKFRPSGRKRYQPSKTKSAQWYCAYVPQNRGLQKIGGFVHGGDENCRTIWLGNQTQ